MTEITNSESAQQASAQPGAGAPAIVSSRSPNSTLGVAVIGCGGRGRHAVDQGLKERIVALTDIDDGTLRKTLKSIAKERPDLSPRTYNDFRKMLDECYSEIDVVLIATPDHVHASAALRAMQHGKHVFCEKPLAHDIYECRMLAEAAVKYNVLTSMGNSGHCGEEFRRACEYIWDGAIGQVRETHTIFGRDFGGTEGRLPTKRVPRNVHWDEWIGPAPYRDYHDDLHVFGWRSWRDFGTGTIGDMACHNLDCLFFALKVNEAKHLSVECLASNGGSEEMWPQGNIVRYDVPARGDMIPLKAYVYDNEELKPEIMKETEKECGITFGECTLYVGDKGLFWTTGAAGKARMLPLEKHEAYPDPPKVLPRAMSDDATADLFLCIKNGRKPASNFPEAAAPLTEFGLLGHLAQSAGVGKRVEWDVEQMRCTNMPEVNRLVGRHGRKGWAV
jgi:predicted dehydrogenase